MTNSADHSWTHAGHGLPGTWLSALALFVYRADTQSAIHRWFASFVACFAVWHAIIAS